MRDCLCARLGKISGSEEAVMHGTGVMLESTRRQPLPMSWGVLSHKSRRCQEVRDSHGRYEHDFNVCLFPVPDL